jgi:hypothetical protein
MPDVKKIKDFSNSNLHPNSDGENYASSSIDQLILRFKESKPLLKSVRGLCSKQHEHLTQTETHVLMVSKMTTKITR